MEHGLLAWRVRTRRDSPVGAASVPFLGPLLPHVIPSHAIPCLLYHSMPSHLIPCHLIPSTPCHAILRHAIPSALCHAMLAHPIPCHPIPSHSHRMPCHAILSHTVPSHSIPCHLILSTPYHANSCHPIPSTPSHAIPSTSCHPIPCHPIHTMSCHAIPHHLHCVMSYHAIPSHLHHAMIFHSMPSHLISSHATPSHPTLPQRAEPAVKPSSSWLSLSTQLSSADLCWEPKIPPFLAANNDCTAASTRGHEGCCHASRIRPPPSSPTRMGALAHVGSIAVPEETTNTAFTHNCNEAASTVDDR